MNFVNNTSNKEINIEITPLIDIVFLLVIFFVVTSKIDSSQAIDIDLPEDILIVESLLNTYNYGNE